MRGLVICVALVAVLAACAPVGAPPAPQPAARTQTGAAGIINAARAAHGLPPATPDARLTAAAQGHAQDMVTRGFIGHQGRNGADHMDRIRAAGYCTPYATENLAWDWPSPDRAAQEWVRSPAHLDNILLSGPVAYGLGVAGERYVLVVARPC